MTIKSEVNPREAGILAIIDLQKCANIEESRARAERGWDRMSAHEQEQTMLAHRSMFPSRYKRT